MTTKTYDTIDVDKLPDLKQGKPFNVDDLPDLKKKDGREFGKLSATGSAEVGLGTASTPLSPSLSTSEVAEGVFSFGKIRNKKGPIKAVQHNVDVNKLAFNVDMGGVAGEELSEAYNNTFSKPVVDRIINEYGADMGGAGWDGVGSSQKWDELAKRIKTKNRINAKTGFDNYLTEVDREINDAPAKYKLEYSYGGGVSGGAVGATEEISLEPFPSININNPYEYAQAIKTLKGATRIVDNNGKEVAGAKDRLIAALKEKEIDTVAKLGISPEVAALSPKITRAIARSNINREIGKSIPLDEFASNDKLNEEQFKLGLSLWQKTDPSLFNNIVSVINADKQLVDDDFRNTADAGQRIYNQQVFFGAATNPELIDKETDIDYTTRSDELRMYSTVAGERLKAKGEKPFFGKYSEEQIRSVLADMPNKSVVTELVNNEKLNNYDAISKPGVIAAFKRGSNQPIEGIISTIKTFSESPVETYIRSKNPNVGSETLPSETNNIWLNAVEGLGQFATQIALTKGIGGIAGGATKAIAGAVGRTVGAEALANTSVYAGTIISTGLQTYGDSFADYMQKTGGDVATSKLGATIDSAVSALAETMLPDVKIADKAFKGLRGQLVNDIIDFAKKGGDPAVLAAKGRPFIEKFFKEYIDISRQEISEEVVTNVVDILTESIFSPRTAENRDMGAEVLETIKQTAISMAIPSLFGATGVGLNPDFSKRIFNEAAVSLPSYKQTLDRALNAGEIDQQSYNNTISILSTHNQSINNAPTENADGKKLTSRQELDYAFEETKIKVYNEKAKNAEGVAKEMWETKIKQSEDIQRKILMPEKPTAEEKPEVKPIDENERFKPKVTDEAQTTAAITEQTEGAAENVAPSTQPADVVPSGLQTGGKFEIKAFHGTGADISDFDVNVNESKDGRNIKGVGWFSDHEAGAKAFGGNVIERDIKFDNPLVVDAKDIVGKEFRFKLPNGEYVYEINNVKELYVQRAKDKGHDGVVFLNAKDGNMSGTVYGVFKNENISKSQPKQQTTPTRAEGVVPSEVEIEKQKKQIELNRKAEIETIPLRGAGQKLESLDDLIVDGRKIKYNGQEYTVQEQKNGAFILADQSGEKASDTPLIPSKRLWSDDVKRNLDYIRYQNSTRGEEIDPTEQQKKIDAVNKKYDDQIAALEKSQPKQQTSPIREQPATTNVVTEVGPNEISQPKQQTSGDIRQRYIDDFNIVESSAFDWRVTSVLSTVDRKKAVEDIKAGKETSATKKLEQEIKETIERGTVIINRGRGNAAQSVEIPVNEWFGLDTKGQDELFVEAEKVDENTVRMIKESDITLQNIDDLKHLFNGFPYEQADFTAVKDYLARQGKRSTQTAQVGESGQTKAEGVTPEQKTVAQQGKELADKIRQLKTKQDILQANIFGIPIAIYDGAIETIATTIETGAQLVEAIQKGIQYIRDNGGNELQEKEFTQSIDDFVGGKKPKVRTTGEIVEEEPKDSSKKGEKATIESKINDIGKNAEDVLLDSVIHRRNVAMPISVEDTAKADKLILELTQNDANSFIQEMKQEYGKLYLKKVLDAILSINKNRVDLDKILAVGVALENEILNIREGFVDNEFGITRNELNKVYAKIQKRNVENARTSSKALNTIKTLYNNYDNSVAKESILTDEQAKQKEALLETLLDDKKLSEAADAHESGVAYTKEASEDVDKKEARKSKVVTEKNKVKAKITDILKDLKDKLNKLDC